MVQVVVGSFLCQSFEPKMAQTSPSLRQHHLLRASALMFAQLDWFLRRARFLTGISSVPNEMWSNNPKLRMVGLGGTWGRALTWAHKPDLLPIGLPCFFEICLNLFGAWFTHPKKVVTFYTTHQTRVPFISTGHQSTPSTWSLFLLTLAHWAQAPADHVIFLGTRRSLTCHTPLGCRDWKNPPKTRAKVTPLGSEG